MIQCQSRVVSPNYYEIIKDMLQYTANTGIGCQTINSKRNIPG
jgi:hypothetical protein